MDRRRLVVLAPETGTAAQTVGPMPHPPAAPTRDRATRVVMLRPAAPAKPPPGDACNGCGLCCAAEPCPLGMWLSRRRRGACAALDWSAEEARYVCGALAQPAQWLPWLPAAWARRLVRRWIAAGTACDADWAVQDAAAG